jgi:hypothetical protein
MESQSGYNSASHPGLQSYRSPPAPAQTQKGFARHVARHLQEISLAALPANDTSPNDDDDSGHDSDNDSDGDSDGDGDDGNNAGNKHDEIVVDGTQSPVPVFRKLIQGPEQDYTGSQLQSAGISGLTSTDKHSGVRNSTPTTQELRDSTWDWAGRGMSHTDFEKDETLPLLQGRFLGYGVNGVVHQTTCNGVALAWKRKFCRYRIGPGELQEIEIIKKLNHRHIIKLVGTYTLPRRGRY